MSDMPYPCGHRTKHTARIGCCGSCRQMFSSDSAFERHRKGGMCIYPPNVALVPKPSRTAPGEVIWSMAGGYYDAEETA